MTTGSQTPDRTLTQVVEGLLAGKRAALAKAISAVESGTDTGRAILSRVRLGAADRSGQCQVVGITGPPGCGKSTLTGRLIAALRARGQRIGVVAVDPSSPVSGGALLGDRLRMAEHASDPQVFVRSLSSRGRLGGLAPAARDVVDLMAGSGMDTIIVETVGAGQTEVEIASLAEVKIVLGAPGLGDDIQAIKSGILEIADIFVVNKGDLPGAEQTAAQLRAMQTLRPASDGRVPVLITSAATGDGIDRLADAITEVAARPRPVQPDPRDLVAVRQALVSEALRKLAAKLDTAAQEIEATYCSDIINGHILLGDAAQEIANGLAIGKHRGSPKS